MRVGLALAAAAVAASCGAVAACGAGSELSSPRQFVQAQVRGDSEVVWGSAVIENPTGNVATIESVELMRTEGTDASRAEIRLIGANRPVRAFTHAELSRPDPAALAPVSRWADPRGFRLAPDRDAERVPGAEVLVRLPAPAGARVTVVGLRVRYTLRGDRRTLVVRQGFTMCRRPCGDLPRDRIDRLLDSL